jgi:hypothetical protein
MLTGFAANIGWANPAVNNSKKTVLRTAHHPIQIEGQV